MREVVEQILDGTYDYEKGSLDFSCAKLEIELQKGEVYEGNFTIFASEGKYTMGYITTTDPRMECLTREFSGNEEVISFCFHGEWMEEGEVTKGEFVVMSNKGEYYLPYVVKVVHTVPQSSMGPVKNLFHFTNLAKSNWKEAVRFYYSPAFMHLLKTADTQTNMLYQGLSVQDGNEQNMEEFLIATGKKQPVEYVITEPRLQVENPQGVVEAVLNIFRNGWGYTYLEVWTEGDFLFVEKNLITDDAFLGNRYALPVYIDETLLHAGKNDGMVYLRNAYVSLQIPVLVTVGRRRSLDYAYHVEKEKNIFKLMNLYQALRLKKINSAAWIKDTTRIVERLLTLDEKDAVIRLYQAHQLITKEYFNEAGWVLEHVGELMGEEVEPALEAYYLYLNTLLRQDAGYTREVGRQVLQIYREYGEDWRVGWLLLFLNEEFNRDVTTKWEFLEEQFENGCHSPLLYVEALQLLNNNATLLRKLGGFEIQVLNYGRKKALINAELTEQVLYLMDRVKEYQPLLYQVLVFCYGQKKDVRILKEICTLLIKGNKTGKEYYAWFEKGVAEELRITNLYEYFMLSLDLQQEPEIPKRVLLYFTYQTNLDYRHNAYLLYYIAKRAREMPDIYESYRPRMELFVREQLLKGHVNRHLAYLYKLFLTDVMIDEDLAEVLATILFAHEIQLEQTGIRSVIVCQPNHLKESVYTVIGDRVWVPLYGNDTLVLFENQQGNRLVKNVQYTTEKLMSPEKLAERVAAFVTKNQALDIYMQETRGDAVEVGTKELYRWMRLLKYPYTPKKIKGELVVKIAQYYYNKDDKKHLMEYLGNLNGRGLSARQRGEIIRYMVLCGHIDKACEWMNLYGDVTIDEKILLRLLEVAIDIRSYEYVEGILRAAYRLFVKSRYSSTTLQYLMLHYQGRSKELRNIWKASKSFSFDRSAFCERILIQMLFTGYFVGEQDEIFKEYVQGKPDSRVKEAYLAKNCYDFFVDDKIMQHNMLAEICRMAKEGHSVLKVCKLAYVKYYAENQQEIRREDEEILSSFLDSLVQEGICLNCFLELKRYSRKALRFADKTIVEYHASAGTQPKIHYLIMKGNEESGEYMTDSMQVALGGVYFKEFVLFFGESLQYYIVEEQAGEEKLTQSGVCHRTENPGEESVGRYGAINDIVMSKALQDYNTFDTLLEEYYKREFFNQALFELRK